MEDYTVAVEAGEILAVLHDTGDRNASGAAITAHKGPCRVNILRVYPAGFFGAGSPRDLGLNGAVLLRECEWTRASVGGRRGWGESWGESVVANIGGEPVWCPADIASDGFRPLRRGEDLLREQGHDIEPIAPSRGCSGDSPETWGDFIGRRNAWLIAKEAANGHADR